MDEKIKRSIAYLCLQQTCIGQASYSHVHEIINGLKRRGYQTTLYEPIDGRLSMGAGAIKRCLEIIRTQMRLMPKLHTYDLLYVRGHFAAFPTSLYAKLIGCPIIQEINGPYEDCFIAWPFTRRIPGLIKYLSRRQMSWANAIITVTDLLGDWCRQEANNDKIFIVPNGANTEVFNPGVVCSIKLPKKYVIFFGALAQWQGIDLLLEATLMESWPSDVSLVIVGDGAMRSAVEAAALTNPLIIYLGVLPQKKLAGVVAGAQAGLICESNLGNRSATGLSPLKLYETLAAGTAAIVTDFPGMADLVRKYKCGIVVKPDSPKEIAAAANHCFAEQTKNKSMGQKGREAVCLEHSWDKRADDTSLIIQLLLDSNCQ